MNDYLFVGVTDAFEGIKQAELELPDLILMDINLPGLSGYEATARIRSVPSLRNVPIVAVTAGAMSGDRERALSVGCVGYITKPIDVDNFVPSIEAFICGQKEEIDYNVKSKFLEEHNLRLIEQLETKIGELESARDHLEEEVSKRTEELIQVHQKVLEMEKNNVVSEISGTIAHELNQPLSILIGYCELLETGQLSFKDSDDITALLMEQANRMSVLVKKLALVTEYKTKQYSTGKIVSMDEVELSEDGDHRLKTLENFEVGSDSPSDIPLLFLLKNKIVSLEREVKDFEGCALAGHLMKAVFHRLNNCFQAIRGYTDLMVSINTEDSADLTYLSKMSGAVDDSIGLLSVFTELLSSHVLEDSPGSSDLEAVTVHIVTLLRQLYRRQLIEYLPVPEAMSGKLIVNCEHSILVRLILSLVLLTMKRISTGAETALSIRLTKDDKTCSIVVRDESDVSFARFEKQQQDRALSSENFVKAPIDTSRIIKVEDLTRTAGDNGGTLIYRGGEGWSEFIVSFPKSSSLPDLKHESLPVDAQRHKLAKVETSDFPRYRILIVDDELSICFILQKHIIAAYSNVDVDTCNSAEEALEFFSEHNYGLVLLDINLPGKSGIEILPQIRASWPETVVIIITGLISEDDLKLAYEQGVFSCLRKPVKKQHLLKILSDTSLKLEPMADLEPFADDGEQ
jgi:CheY-like chemotaxis protein